MEYLYAVLQTTFLVKYNYKFMYMHRLHTYFIHIKGKKPTNSFSPTSENSIADVLVKSLTIEYAEKILSQKVNSCKGCVPENSRFKKTCSTTSSI